MVDRRGADERVVGDAESLYTDHDRERLVPEPPKRVIAPTRTAFERDRARLVHAASTRRLAAKTQVLGPQSDDFVRNRLTHTLEVAQIARDLSRAIGSHPDIAETAALAHDLGHPPFGHNGELVLADWGSDAGGFEGNAQTLRIIARLEAKSFDADGRSVGLNLTRATLDACIKYPWAAGDVPGPKFGVYGDDAAVYSWVRLGAPAGGKSVEAQIMDIADDVAYSVHDVEDGVVFGAIELTALDHEAVASAVREHYLPDAQDGELAAAWAVLTAFDTWPQDRHDGSLRHLARLKNLTSDLIGFFCSAVQVNTHAASAGPYVRHASEVVVPRQTQVEIAVLKGVARHYVMDADDQQEKRARQRDLLRELLDAIAATEARDLERPFADAWAEAADDAARKRVVIDQVASLTDVTAVRWHARLVG